MKIQIASDLHVETRQRSDLQYLVSKTDADVIVLAGDIGTINNAPEFINQLAELHEKPILYVLGNHEFYRMRWEQVRKEMPAKLAESIHVLDDSVVIIDGTRFLGTTLWTDFNLFGNAELAMRKAFVTIADFFYIQVGDSVLKPEQTVRWHMESVQWLKSELRKPFDGKTVVVSHHAPTTFSLAKRFASDPLSPVFVSDLRSLFEGNIDLWIHGHTHDHFDYVCNGTRVVCNSAGYPGEDDGGDTLQSYRHDWVLTI